MRKYGRQTLRLPHVTRIYFLLKVNSKKTLLLGYYIQHEQTKSMCGLSVIYYLHCTSLFCNYGDPNIDERLLSSIEYFANFNFK